MRIIFSLALVFALLSQKKMSEKTVLANIDKLTIRNGFRQREMEGDANGALSGTKLVKI
jgi:hypothetical protein